MSEPDYDAMSKAWTEKQIAEAKERGEATIRFWGVPVALDPGHLTTWHRRCECGHEWSSVWYPQVGEDFCGGCEKKIGIAWGMSRPVVKGESIDDEITRKLKEKNDALSGYQERIVKDLLNE